MLSRAEHDLIFFAELAYTMKVDNKTDVYSFGVVTLEVIMGRHPGELISSLLSSASSSSASPSTVGHFLLNDVIDQRPSPPVIHRDISSNNVLLDSEYEAHVSDFSTARLLKLDSSN